MEGDEQGDSYRYNSGDGNDQIVDYSVSTENSEHLGDILVLGPGITAQNTIVWRRSADLDDLVLTFVGEAGSVRIEEQFGSDNYGVEEIHFDDGAIWYEADLLAAAIVGVVATGGDDVISGTSGNDVIDGLAGNDSLSGLDGYDTLIGGLGNDWMDGGHHGDSYVYNLGDGHDTIREYSSASNYRFGDKLIFGAGIAADDILISQSTTDWKDLTLSFVFGDGSILLDEQFGHNKYGLEAFHFADGDDLVGG